MGNFRNGILLCLVVSLLATNTSCETMSQNKTATGAVLGTLVGAATGALAGGKKNRGEGALIGAAAGALVGAAIGYGVKEWENSKIEQTHSQPYAVNEQSSEELKVAKENTVTTPKVEIFHEDSVLSPTNEFRPGDQLKAILVFRAVVKSNTNRQLCRQDVLKIQDPQKGEFSEVKTFDEDRTLPVSGINENVTKFAIPVNAPTGTYQLVSRVYDPNDPGLADETTYSFNIVK